MVFDFYTDIGLKITVEDPNVNEPVEVKVRKIDTDESRIFGKIYKDEIFSLGSKGRSNYFGCSPIFLIDTSCPLNNST